MEAELFLTFFKLACLFGFVNKYHVIKISFDDIYEDLSTFDLMCSTNRLTELAGVPPWGKKSTKCASKKVKILHS